MMFFRALAGSLAKAPPNKYTPALHGAQDGRYLVFIVVRDDDGGLDMDSFTVKVGSGVGPTPVPSLTQWGFIAMVALMGLVVVWRLRGATRRRQV